VITGCQVCLDTGGILCTNRRKTISMARKQSNIAISCSDTTLLHMQWMFNKLEKQYEEAIADKKAAIERNDAMIKAIEVCTQS